MASIAALLSLSIFTVVSAQQVGTNTAEVHPSLTWQTCKTSGGCTTVNGKVVLDANWRWVHSNTGYTNCYTGNTWDATLCPNSATCVANCALDGADYPGTYGITTSGNALTLKFVTNNASGKNIGSRTYLMKDDSTYQNFALLNQEFTFDVDVSQLPCGLNGALYFSEMALDGGMSANPTNKAGAKYGTGYCDSQCPRDLKFINGQVGALVPPSSLFLIPSSYRPTLRVGPLQDPTLVPVPTVLAATRWTSGRPTPSGLPIPLILARRRAFRCAQAPPASSPIDTLPSATLTAVISTRTVWATLASMALERQSTAPRSSLSSHSS